MLCQPTRPPLCRAVPTPHATTTATPHTPPEAVETGISKCSCELGQLEAIPAAGKAVA